MYNKDDINFIAIDFETATSKRTSVCEIGICVVRNGEIVETRSWLVRPEGNYYQYQNIKIHGISPEDTVSSPDFRQIWEKIEFAYLDDLDYLCSKLQIPKGTHHRAGDDAEMCARLYLRELKDIYEGIFKQQQ